MRMTHIFWLLLDLGGNTSPLVSRKQSSSKFKICDNRGDDALRHAIL